MLLSLDWLKDFIKFPKSLTPEEIGKGLTFHTVEVEDIERQADKFKNVVVGKILEIKKHPNADKLRLAKVKIGKEILDIVCGAPNINEEQLVPVAMIGAILPNGLEIKEAEIRGEKSFGMLCAADELGLGNDHAGIMILGDDAKIGMNFGEYLGLNDIIFNIDNKSLSNRPDLLGHYGMAREISAIFDISLIKKDIDVNLKTDNSELKLEAIVENQNLCPRYMAISMKGIKVQPSPKWMQNRLTAIGIRPINNVVDITNYVMMELGQPLHAFDRSKLGGNEKNLKIMIRSAKEGEIMETLDGEKRKLSKEMIVIADEKNPIALAGVMGGASSEISDNTTSIIIESANFNPISIRKTAGKLNLRTESSTRFEKSLDPNLCETAIARAAGLIKELCGKDAEINSNLVDEKKFALNIGPIELDLKWLAEKIGEKIPTAKITKILSNLGFEVKKSEHSLEVMIPSFRATRDISIREDLVEEITRIYGYNNLKPEMPKVEINAPEVNHEKVLERNIKNILARDLSLSEVYNYSFVNENDLSKLNINFSSYLRLANPIASQFTLLRQNLLPNLLNNVKTNQARYKDIKIFEIGSIFLPLEGDLVKDSAGKEFLPFQEKRLGIVLASNEGDNIFSEVKGIAEYLLKKFNLEIRYKQKESVWDVGAYDKQCFADIFVRGENIGFISKIDNKIGSGFGLKKEVVFAEIRLNQLLKLSEETNQKKYEPLPKFPKAERDLSFVINGEIMYNDIVDEIMGFNELIKNVELFDVYQGEKLGAGKKSLAFHIIYQAERTLAREEVDAVQKELVKKLEEKFEIKVRDF